jgi:hypothetical protein
MILLFRTLLFALTAARLLAAWRAARLEKRFSAAARAADQALRLATVRPGNASRADPFEAAKAQLRLGLLADRRDRLEAKHDAWQARADRLTRAVGRLRGWKGRGVPYVFGALDAALTVAALNALGVRGNDVREWLRTLRIGA